MDENMNLYTEKIIDGKWHKFKELECILRNISYAGFEIIVELNFSY